ncbi:hypothetical protein CE91St36_08710 [Christensenellaceae bacterium]|nr:hypothetical protein CE91St36_08710 [Christensenellaceae bacterium]BDF60722.1 hypothetical protein CE91St37_08720 [Christensenellaceae bacterium]
MRLKKMLFWQWKSNRLAFLIFYLIVAVATIALSLLFSGQTGSDRTFGAVPSASTTGIIISSSLGSFNMATFPFALVFLFVLGLASFGENIRLAISNGVSRRTHYVSFLLFALAAAVVTSLLSILFDAIPYFFGTSGASSQFAGSFIVLFVFFFTVYLFFMVFGYFLAGAYYRMNTAAKIIVSIGVPAAVIAFLAGALSFHPDAPLYSAGVALLAFGDWMTNTANAALFFLLLSAIFLFLGWLLTRRAPVKAPAE